MPKHKYTKLNNRDESELIKIPRDCQRCVSNGNFNPGEAKIKCVYFQENNRTEYICVNCKLADPRLRNLVVKKKVLSDAQKEILFMSLVVPNECERCEINPVNIRKFDNSDNTVEFICWNCKGSDKKLKGLPVKPKIVRK